jgi:hypothetical protein
VPLGSEHDCFDDNTAIDIDRRHRRSWYLAQFSDLLPESELQARNCDWRDVSPITFHSPRVDPGWHF